MTGRNPITKQPLAPHGGIPDSIRIMHNVAGKLGHWEVKEESLLRGDVPRWIEHPSLGDKADIVALPLTDLHDVELYPYDLDAGPKIALFPAETISVVGFPFGLRAGGSLAVWATGFVASELDIDFNDLPIFLVDCRTRPGQSGSAVIAHRNGGAVALEDGSSAMFAGSVTRFFGIYSGRINEQSDIGMVWKAAAVKEVISAV